MKKGDLVSLDFNDFINVARHYKKIQHGAQEIKDRYSVRPSETKRYLLELFDFFLNDIKQVADHIYSEILHKKSSLGKQFYFTVTDLKGCIENGTHSLLSSYNRIIIGYNVGGILRTIDDFDKEMSSFSDEAKALCKKQAEIYKNQYIEWERKNFREFWTFIGAVVGGATGAASVIIGILSLVGFKISLNFATDLSTKDITQHLINILSWSRFILFF